MNEKYMYNIRNVSNGIITYTILYYIFICYNLYKYERSDMVSYIKLIFESSFVINHIKLILQIPEF